MGMWALGSDLNWSRCRMLLVLFCMTSDVQLTLIRLDLHSLIGNTMRLSSPSKDYIS
jgi:hypothetical protein